MKILRLTLVIFTFIISFASAEEFKTVKINGTISVKGAFAKEGSIRFDVYKNASLRNVFEYESVEAKLDNEGYFEIEIIAPSDFFCVEITSILPPSIKRVLYTHYTKGKYLLNRNDDFMMIIEDENILFSGIGADRLNCQHEILKMLYRFSFKTDESNKKDYYARFKNAKVTLDEIEEMKLSTLKSYQLLLSQLEVRLISDDIRYLKDVSMLSFLANYIYLGPESQKGGEEFYNEFYNEESVNNPFLALQTAYFTDYLFQKAKVSAILKCMTPEIDLEIFTDSLFNIIIEDYDGEVRDRLLVDFFISRQDRMRKDQAARLYEKGFALVKAVYCRERLAEWGDINFNLKPMFPFELTSERGKIFSPSDFKGKVVIFKFWFWGCVPCAILAEQMNPIMERYASNPDVVFVSVNVDDNIGQWKHGLESGKYTSEGEICLYTNGVGRNHPMLKHYNFTGFPQLLIMDKFGNCLDSFIERPVDEESTKKFNSLLDNALNSK